MLPGSPPFRPHRPGRSPVDPADPSGGIPGTERGGEVPLRPGVRSRGGGSNSDFDHKSGTVGHRAGGDPRRIRGGWLHSYRVFTLNHREIRITVSLQRLAFISMNPGRIGDGVLNIAITPCGIPECIVM